MMKIQKEHTLGKVLMIYPHIYSYVISLGLCCVDERSALWTMERLAEELFMEADELCEMLNDAI